MVGRDVGPGPLVKVREVDSMDVNDKTFHADFNPLHVNAQPDDGMET